MKKVLKILHVMLQQDFLKLRRILPLFSIKLHNLNSLFYKKSSDSGRLFLYPHCTQNLIYVFSEMKLLGLVPNSYIHVSVSDLLIPMIGLPLWLQRNRQTSPRNIEIAHRYMNVEIGRQNITILFWK